jgi:two-component system, OmpR family, response regulator VicR
MAKKLLVIEDEKDIVEILKAILEHEGYEVLCAYDGEEGIKSAIENKPDLVVTDIMMPKMDGFEVAEKLKEHPETSVIPIVMLTAKDQEVDRQRGLSLGIAAYIIKLFDLEELIATIKETIEHKK